MAKTCTSCGSPLDDNARFCTVCGTPVPIQTVTPDRYCVQCGNLLKPNTKFCEICGREVSAPKPKEEPVIAEPTTMDELVIPEINEETFAKDKAKMMAEKFDGFEAAVMPDSQPAQPEAPAPAPEFAMDSAASDTPKPKQTVTVKPKAVNPQPNPNAARAQQYGQPAPQQTAPNAQQPNNPYPNPGMPIPTVRADGKEKKGLSVVQIILILAIIIVVIVDIILFGGKKSGEAEENAANILPQTSVGVQADCTGTAAEFL